MSRSNKLAPEANRILFVKNLAYNVDSETFVVYDEVLDAKQACDKLNGFNFMNRYLVVLYHQPEKMKIEVKEDIAARQENLERMKREHGIE
ncbi:hypothetical protein LTS17_012090 [Exophiala oligosperma]